MLQKIQLVLQKVQLRADGSQATLGGMKGRLGSVSEGVGRTLFLRVTITDGEAGRVFSRLSKSAK